MRSMFFLAFVCIASVASGQFVEKISMHSESGSLKNGKKVNIEADIFYMPETGKYVSHHLYPEEFIKITNRVGEMKVYFVEDNEVALRQDFYFSSENELLHYFVNNLTDDLGLRKEGFALHNTYNDEEYLVTIWKAPPTIKVVNAVKIVFMDELPVYAEYINQGDQVIRKIYYSGYKYFEQFVIPQRITEITFANENDSTIKRTLYSDFKINNQVDTYYLNFQIPDDAKVIE